MNKVKLKDIAKIYDGIHETPNYVNDGVKFVSVEDINNIYESKKFITEKDYIDKYNVIPQFNDILMTRIGDIGTPAICNHNEKLAYYVSLALIKLNKDINPHFILYAIQSILFKRELWKRTIHVAFPKKINLGEIGECSIPITNLPEQNKIATFLNLYYKKIELQKKKIDLMQKFLNREINNISHVCEDYILFKDCYIKAGEGGTPSTSISEFYDNGNIPFAKIEDLSKKYLFNTSSFITELGVQKSGAWIIPINSVIYSNGATIGEVSINKIEITTKQGILGIIPKKNISEEFLYYYMKSQYFRKEICKITTFGTMLSAYLKDIDKIKLFIPEFELQEIILCKINRINKKLDLEKKKLSLLEKYKQGLLQQLFV